LAKPLSIDSGVLRRLRELPKSERVECLLALCELAERFGRPHAHSGLGIRKLGNKLFECRAGLALRCIFQDRPTFSSRSWATTMKSQRCSEAVDTADSRDRA
jgi:hypothetical protein